MPVMNDVLLDLSIKHKGHEQLKPEIGMRVINLDHPFPPINKFLNGVQHITQYLSNEEYTGTNHGNVVLALEDANVRANLNARLQKLYPDLTGVAYMTTEEVVRKLVS